MGKDSRDLPGQALLDAAWFDPIEVMVRDRVRGFIENLVEAELDDALGRSRYQRPGTANVASSTAGYRHGPDVRQLCSGFNVVSAGYDRGNTHRWPAHKQETMLRREVMFGVAAHRGVA
jgi:hypothetical protein